MKLLLKVLVESFRPDGTTLGKGGNYSFSNGFKLVNSTLFYLHLFLHLVLCELISERTNYIHLV